MGSDDVETPIRMRCMRCQEEFADGRQVCPHDGTRLIVALPDPMIGTTFADRYEIIDVLGRGGMSVVYKAQQIFMQNLVAIKVLHQTLHSDPTSFDRFKQEAVAAISIRDKNVIQVLDFGISDEKAFLIMEYLEGQDLSDWLTKNGEMDVERALDIFIQACSGLASAHAKGVIHRDLKPGNLFLMKEEDGRDLVKIVDFGIAKIESSHSQSLTQPGEVFGSPLYMSPEQCQGKPLDARSDIYSLGCVLYETLSGSPPLMGINSFETMNKHVGEQPLPIRAVVPNKEIPEALDACILKALQKNPDQRQQTMQEFKQELIDSVKGSRFHLQESGTGLKPVGTPPGPEDVGTETVVDLELGAKAKEELQKLVLDAVDLTKKQDAHNRRLRQMVLVLYVMLGSLVMTLVWLATKPGPQSDPAPFYKQEPYRWKISEAEAEVREGKYKQALATYRAAVEMSKDFGEGTEKRTKALLGLLICLEHTGADQETIKQARHQLLDANIKHMEYIYGHDGHDLARIIDMDAGLLQRIGGSKIDRAYAESLAKQYVANAKDDFQKKNFVKSLSWLQEALEIEEQNHCDAGVAATAEGFKASQEGNDHIEQIKELLNRAVIAEQSSPHQSELNTKELNQPKSTMQ